MVIENAMGVAEGVAKIILENSFALDEDLKVHDIMLFGSTLNKNGKDLDFLVIHALPGLSSYGMFTKYDENQHRMVEDPDWKIENERYTAESILRDMGSRRFDNELECELGIRESLRGLGTIRELPEEIDVPYIGTIQLRELGYLGANKLFDAKIDEYCKESVLNNTQGLLRSNGLTIEHALDLHVFQRDLLNPSECAEERRYAISHCNDPTFWSSILENGRLYDPESGRFSRRVNDKYPGAVELFAVT